MATNVAVGGADQPREEKPSKAAASSGFFTIYKKGQGKWTRLCTAIGAALIGALTAQFLFTYIPNWITSTDQVMEQRIAAGVAAGFFVVYALIIYWVLNKPKHADFLIATDGEMKKVNWTSRRELIGSTKVVIVFMLLIALILFLYDVGFGYLFWLMGVLKASPFG